jgi:rhodanese-related sulfurtransferase
MPRGCRRTSVFSKLWWREDGTMPDDELRIDPAEAKARVEASEAIILDVVAPHVWPEMHRAIAGAVRIDPHEIGERYGEFPTERQIIAYCT